MKKGTNGMKVMKMINVFFDSLTFVSIQYILLCCMFSFRESIIYVFFIALNASIISKHWSNLRNEINNKLLFVAIFTSCFLVLAVFILLFGYLEISTVLKEAI